MNEYSGLFTPSLFENEESYLFFPKKVSIEEKERWKSTLERVSLQNVLWFLTSGSEARKWIALPKKGFLEAASAACDHLKITGEDTLSSPLPSFHVGGFSLFARGMLAQASVLPFPFLKWDPLLWAEFVEEKKITITSLVPTQVYDLIQRKIKPPSSLRACLVGGGELSEGLYIKARKYGWPLLPTYGMTEVCSQIATAPLSSLNEEKYPLLEILPHVILEKNEEKKAVIQSKALFKGHLFADSLEKGFFLREGESWVAEDFIELEAGKLKKSWRPLSFAKIGGESVSLSYLQEILEEILLEKEVLEPFRLLFLPDERLGKVVGLAGEADSKWYGPVVDIFNKKVMPFEQIRKISLGGLAFLENGKVSTRGAEV